MSKELSDGAWITVTQSRDVDRMGRVYDAAIMPDAARATEWATFGTEGDPVIRAAITWLSTSP